MNGAPPAASGMGPGQSWPSPPHVPLARERPPAGDAPATAAEITGIRLSDGVMHVTYLSGRDQRSTRAALSGSGQAQNGAFISIREP
jgi:hypothetical protein